MSTFIPNIQCPVCQDDVYEHPSNEGEPVDAGDLVITECWDHGTETFAADISYLKCASDHTFYMDLNEIAFKTTT